MGEVDFDSVGVGETAAVVVVVAAVEEAAVVALVVAVHDAPPLQQASFVAVLQ